jgi:hypothetical protein
MSIKLVYLASPYSAYGGGRKEAFKLACKKAAEVMSMGYAVFCPIAHSHSIEEIGMGGEVMSGDWWLEQDFGVLDKCDELWVYMMPGWEKSYGVGKEIERAKRLGLPIEYLYFDDKERAYFKT